MVKLYRAIEKNQYQPQTIYRGHMSRRAPSNVPYLVDNLWEYFRPEHFPSRRHAIYASPSVELALANASSGKAGSEYMACEIITDTENLKMAHLKVTDARYHSDVRNLPRLVLATLKINDLSLYEKLAYAPLFMPCITKDELQAACLLEPMMREVIKLCREQSTFWLEASDSVSEHDGELFFSLGEAQHYQLKKID